MITPTQLINSRPQFRGSNNNDSRRTAEALLRDAAFVMEMTRRVKEEMMTDQLQTAVINRRLVRDLASAA